MRKVVLDLDDLMPETRQRIAWETQEQNVLDVLANDEDSIVRIRTARCCSNQDTILILSQDENPEVRKAIAGNSNTPNSILEKLSKDPNEEIRNFVARCFKTIYSKQNKED